MTEARRSGVVAASSSMSFFRTSTRFLGFYSHFNPVRQTLNAVPPIKQTLIQNPEPSMKQVTNSSAYNQISSGQAARVGRIRRKVEHSAGRNSVAAHCPHLSNTHLYGQAGKNEHAKQPALHSLGPTLAAAYSPQTPNLFPCGQAADAGCTRQNAMHSLERSVTVADHPKAPNLNPCGQETSAGHARQNGKHCETFTGTTDQTMAVYWVGATGFLCHKHAQARTFRPAATEMWIACCSVECVP